MFNDYFLLTALRLLNFKHHLFLKNFIKNIAYYSMLSAIILLPVACKSNDSKASKNSSNSSATSTTSSSATPSSGKGTISCTMDGKPYTHTVTKSFYEVNASTKMPVSPNDKSAEVMIVLREGDSKNEGFEFDIPNSSGENIFGSGGHKSNMGYFNKSGVVYAAQTGQINVLSFDGNHLTGTFSGDFEKVNGEADFPQTIKMENGKFDLYK